MLDAASNRRQTTILGTTQTYALDASMQTRDLAANQYTFVGNSARSHDLMGNLVGQSDTGRQAFYDADNRLVQWTEGSKDVRYRYDVDGRRTVKEDVGTASFPRTVYFWDGWQTVEETNSAGDLQRQYVWGEGIDECLKAHLKDAADIDGDSSTTDFVDLYYHHNSIGSVAAVTKANGDVVESYRYSAFGKPTIYNASNVEIAATAVKQPFMFTGARYDFEEGSGLYQMRHRYYDPVVGRFVSRDPLGLWGDPSQKGNGQGYCGHNPVNWVDPLGCDSVRAPTVVVHTTDAETRKALTDEVKKQVSDFYKSEFAGRSTSDGNTVNEEGVTVQFDDSTRPAAGMSADGSTLHIYVDSMKNDKDGNPPPEAGEDGQALGSTNTAQTGNITLFVDQIAGYVDTIARFECDQTALDKLRAQIEATRERILKATGGDNPTEEQRKLREFLIQRHVTEANALGASRLNREWIEKNGTPNVDSATAGVLIHELWHSITRKGHGDPGSVTGDGSPYLEGTKLPPGHTLPPSKGGTRGAPGFSDPTKDAILGALGVR